MKNFFIVLLMLIIVAGTSYGVWYQIDSYNNKDKVVNKEETKIENDKETKVEEKEKETSIEDIKQEETDLIEKTLYTPKCNKEYDTNQYYTDVDVTKYKNIFEYAYAQDNVSITLSYPKDEGNKNGLVEKQYKFSNDEIKGIINEMENSNIAFGYGGLGGVSSWLTIEYVRNENSYYFKLYGLNVISTTNDGNIYKIIDEYIGNIDIHNDQVKFCFYGFDKKSSIVTNKENELINN